jgi:hypothetical protein
MISIRPYGEDGRYRSLGQMDLPGNTPCMIPDHMNGFNKNLRTRLLDELHEYTDDYRPTDIEYILTDEIKQKYPRLDLRFSLTLWTNENRPHLIVPQTRIKRDFQNFVCSFNHSLHNSRKLILGALYSYGFFNPEYCSKHYSFSSGDIEKLLLEYCGDSYYKSFLAMDDPREKFYNMTFPKGEVSHDHGKNFKMLAPLINNSFVHLVSETMATGYYPFVTEKLFYSVAAKGLFLAYAQPGWHDHVEKYFGFKKYNKIFDYHFDSIQNPVSRLIALFDMMIKFSKLRKDQWEDLYELEFETILYNYEHFASGSYLTHVKEKLNLATIPILHTSYKQNKNRASTS